jgi:putative intracellular protease/amidase
MNQRKLVALLCSSTGPLGVANNLSGEGTPIAIGRNVTGYKRVKGLLTVMGKVNFSSGEKGKPHVVVDGNLITGRDPISSQLFAETIVKQLK